MPSLTRSTVTLLCDPADVPFAETVRRGMLHLSPRRLRPSIRVAAVPEEGGLPRELPDGSPGAVVALLSERLAQRIDTSALPAPGPRGLVLALLSGDLGWSGPHGAWDEMRNTAMPKVWAEDNDREPRWVDLRWLPGARRPQRDPRFADCLAELCAPVLGLTKAQLTGREEARLRRIRLAIVATVLVALVGTVTASFASASAARRRQESQRQLYAAQTRRIAESAAGSLIRRPDLAFLLAAEAWRREPGYGFSRSLATIAASELRGVQVLHWPDGRQARSLTVRPDSTVVVGYVDGTATATRSGSTRTVLADQRLRDPFVLAADDAVLVIGHDGDVARLDAELRPTMLRATDGAVTAAAWSAPLHALLLGDASGNVTAWQPETGRTLWTTHTADGPVTGLAAGRTSLLAAASGGDEVVTLLALTPQGATVVGHRPNLSSDEPPADRTAISALAFVHGDSRLAVGGGDGHLRMFSLTPFKAMASSAQYTSQGLRNPAGGAHSGGITTIVELGDLLLTSALDQQLHLWDPASGQYRYTQGGLTGTGSYLAVVPSGTAFVQAGMDGLVMVRPDPMQHPLLGFGDVGLAGAGLLDADPSGRLLLATSAGETTLRTVPDLRMVAKLPPGHRPGSMLSAAVGAGDGDGRTVYLASEQGTVEAWDTSDGSITTVARLSASHLPPVLALSPSGDRLVAVADQSVTVWRTTGGQLAPERTVTALENKATTRPVFLGDAEIALITATGRVAVLDLVSGRVHQVPDLGTTAVALAADPKSRRLAVAHAGGTVLVTDLDTGVGTRVPDVGGEVSALAFVDSARDLAIGLGDGELLIVGTDAESLVNAATVPARLGSRFGRILAIHALPDGRLATAGLSGSEIWQLSLRQLIDLGCSIVDRTFTEDESRRFGVTAGTTPCRAPALAPSRAAIKEPGDLPG